MPVECRSPAYPHLADGRVEAALLDWYDVQARDLPWRSPPGAPPPDPYRVWLSEIMLQQTTTAAAAPYFARFVARWPTVEALAAADEGELMAAWAGLGYYARARNLLTAARAVAAGGGRFPDSEEGLRALPGVGAYTAAAVAAIAFGRRALVIDANVERVAARLAAIEVPLPAAKPAIRAAVDAMTPECRAGDFAQAMMDLGATICTPRQPDCPQCPVRRSCAVATSDKADRLPLKAPKAAKPHRRGIAWWIEAEDAIWLVRRPAKGMLGGMRALPDDGWRAGSDGSGLPPFDAEWRDLGEVDHVFTHFRLTLALRLARVGRDDMLGREGIWTPIAALDDAGLPTLFAKVVRLAREKRHERV